MAIGSLQITIVLPGINSLKAKRHIIKPMLARLHKEFNVSVAEMDYLDSWQNAKLQVVMVCNNARILEATLQQICDFIKNNWPENYISDEKFELI